MFPSYMFDRVNNLTSYLSCGSSYKCRVNNEKVRLIPWLLSKLPTETQKHPLASLSIILNIVRILILCFSILYSKHIGSWVRAKSCLKSTKKNQEAHPSMSEVIFLTLNKFLSVFDFFLQFILSRSNFVLPRFILNSQLRCKKFFILYTYLMIHF